MNSYQLVQAMAGTIYLVTITTVGIRLLFLARRNRGIPELLIGSSLLLGGTFGSTFEASGMSGELNAIEGASGLLLGIGKLLGDSGFILQALFIRSVFRQGERWATALVAVIVCFQVGTYIGYAAAGTYASGVIPTGLFVIEFVGRCIGSTWLTIEALRYYSTMKKRVALGLSDPIVADRFRLWAVAGIAAIALLSTSVPPILTPESQSVLMRFLIPTFAIGGTVASAAYLLAFFPPSWYHRRVAARFDSARP